jgi:hypothetical protein
VLHQRQYKKLDGCFAPFTVQKKNHVKFFFEKTQSLRFVALIERTAMLKHPTIQEKIMPNGQ